MKIAGIILVTVGILALVYQGFTFQHPEQVAKIGSLSVTAEKHDFVWVPPLVGVLVLASGVALLIIPKRGI